MNSGKKIVTNTAFLVLSSLINLGISLITTALIGRTLGPELYGKYTFGLTYILIFSVLANFGIESLFVREAARDNNYISEMMMDIIHLKCVLAFATVCVIILSANLLEYPESTINVICVLSVGLFFQIVYMSLISVYKALEKMLVVAFFSVIFRVLTAVMIVVAIYFKVGLMGIVWAFTIGNMLVFLGAYAVFYRDFRILHFRFNARNWVGLILKGFPFYLSAILSMIYYKINVLILSKMQGEVEIGYYMAAATLVETLYFMPEAINTAIFPAFSRLYGFSREALERTYAKMIKYVILIAVAVCGGCLLVGDEILLLIYGGSFLESVLVLRVLIYFWVFAFISNIMSYLLFSIKREQVQVRVMVLACILSIVLNYVLIENYGFIGSAYAIVITEGVGAFLMGGLLWKSKLKYLPDWSTARLVFPLIMMVITVQILNGFNVALVVAGGAVSYIVSLFVFRVFDEDDIRTLQSLFRRKAVCVSQ